MSESLASLLLLSCFALSINRRELLRHGLDALRQLLVAMQPAEFGGRVGRPEALYLGAVGKGGQQGLHHRPRRVP